MGRLSRIAAALNRDAHRPLVPPLFGQGRVSRWVLPRELWERTQHVRFRDEGHGIDAFGLNAVGAARGLAVTYWLYEYWFRVISHGMDNIPDSGPVVMASNHGGMLPLDAMMICHDVLRHHRAHRVVRTAMEYFVPGLPVVNLVFSRAGAVAGSRGNFHALLEAGELLLTFPEGVQGIGKPASERYQLQRWHEGHAELAIRHQAAVVPVGVIGPDEQWPELLRIQGVHVYGIPYLPIPATPVPLPVRYHIWYGEPIPVADHYSPDQASDPRAVAELAGRVRDAVSTLLGHGLAQREGVFR
jgi:1-acyl-sn-glycerol-3-phosphate acyltransferase